METPELNYHGWWGFGSDVSSWGQNLLPRWGWGQSAPPSWKEPYLCFPREPGPAWPLD